MKTQLLEPEPLTRSHATPWRAASSRTESEPARILYADDDALLRKLGKLVLVRSGYVVDTSEDGADAWTALNQTRYHLLITDNDMPRLTGRQLITQARRAEMRLPILMTSGSFNPLGDLPGAGPGITAFLPKPFTSDMLVAIVEQTLRMANHWYLGPGAGTSAWARPTGVPQPRSYGGINE